MIHQFILPKSQNRLYKLNYPSLKETFLEALALGKSENLLREDFFIIKFNRKVNAASNMMYYLKLYS
jgi:hypothetical protein